MKEKVGQSESLIKSLFYYDACPDGVKGCHCYDVRVTKRIQSAKLMSFNPFHILNKLIKKLKRTLGITNR